MFDPRQELSSLRTPTAEVRNMASHACITSLEMLESITLTCTWTKLYQFQNRNDIMMTWFRNSFSVFKKSMCEKFKYVCCALPDYHLLFSTYISAECCNPGCLAPLENLVGVHFILKHLCWFWNNGKGCQLATLALQAVTSPTNPTWIYSHMDAITCGANKRWQLQKETRPTVCRKTNTIITIQTFYDLLIFKYLHSHHTAGGLA